MRLLTPMLLSACLVSPALAQNAAPVQQDSKTHVTPQQKSAATAESQKAASAQRAGTPAPEGKPVVLDSVIAIVNGDVLLQSDVEEERRFDALEPVSTGGNTNVNAAEHLITRTLILQQMKLQDQSGSNISAAELSKFIADLKKQLPGCMPVRCVSDAGWASYLAERGLSPAEVADRWQQRLVILNYVNLRFRTGARIPSQQVQDYYDKTLVPQFAAKHQKPPALKALKPRIEEILLQEAVTKQVDEWESTLRQDGSVQILVPAYGESNSHAEQDDDLPGGAL